MLTKPTLLTIVAMVLALAPALSNASATEHIAPCTTTATYTESECCPQYPAHTAWLFPDCDGCELQVETIPLNCFAPCTVSPTTDPAKTTTLTECEQTFSVLPVWTRKRR